MTHLENKPANARRNSPSAITALFGWFFALCSILSLFAAANDAWNEWRQAGWPTAQAAIVSSEVSEYYPFKRNGGGILWSIRCNVQFVADDRQLTAKIRSRSTKSDSERGHMEAWVAEHKPRTSIQIRYDPGDPSNALFASSDVPMTGRQSGSDLVLVAAFAAGFALFLAAARRLRLAGK